jgi:hypothetical protein
MIPWQLQASHVCQQIFPTATSGLEVLVFSYSVFLLTWCLHLHLAQNWYQIQEEKHGQRMYLMNKN